MLRDEPVVTMTTLEIACSVCGEPLETHTEAYCDNCGKPYHLNQRTDRPGKDCGLVWISEEHLSLEFGCDTCLHPEPPAEALDDIMDSTEAAALAGMAEADLIAAAAHGALRHRKTAGGVYLFQRGDVLAFNQAGP